MLLGFLFTFPSVEPFIVRTAIGTPTARAFSKARLKMQEDPEYNVIIKMIYRYFTAVLHS